MLRNNYKILKSLKEHLNKNKKKFTQTCLESHNDCSYCIYAYHKFLKTKKLLNITQN